MNQNIIIYGLGRSGSNILLDTTDLLNFTHCRSEPHSYSSSPIQSKIFDRNDSLEASMSQHWDDIVHWMSWRWGQKDRHHPDAPPKVYYRQFFWNLGLPQFLIRKNRSRKALSIFYPEFKNTEYQLPSWMLTPNWHEKATHVFKMNSSLEQHLSWIIKHRPETKIVFLIRHPLGYAQSLYRRFYSRFDEEEVNSFYEKNCDNIRSRLKYARENNLDVPSPDVSSLNPFESVIWSWLLFNEISYQLYSNQQSVITVVYEQLLANPVEQIKAVFDHCGLPWNSELAQKIQTTYGQSARLAQSFRDYWDEDAQKVAAEILSHSSIQSFWSDQLWENLDNLAKEQLAAQPSYSPY